MIGELRVVWDSGHYSLWKVSESDDLKNNGYDMGYVIAVVLLKTYKVASMTRW